MTGPGGPDEVVAARVAAALSARADALLGVSAGEVRQPPAFDAGRLTGPPDRIPQPGRLRRAAPLLAAACIALVAALALVVAGRAPSHPGPAGRPTHHRQPSPPPHAGTPRATVPPGGTVVRVGAAQIALPHGWVARSWTPYLQPGAVGPLPGRTCLTPAAVPARPGDAACPIRLDAVDRHGDRLGVNRLDVDTWGGYDGDARFCADPGGAHITARSEQLAVRRFGGRVADWRRWELHCSVGPELRLEQYVVAGDPAYVLFSQHASGAVARALHTIATDSALPVQDLPLRLEDRGVVVAVSGGARGTTVTLRRLARRLLPGAPPLFAPVTPPTATYLVPPAVARAADVRLRTGVAVKVFTDGARVYAVLADLQ